MRHFYALLALALLFSLACAPAFADSYETVPHPTSVWDTTTGSLYGIGIPGHGQPVTIIPNAATTNSWTAPNTFTDGVNVTGGSVGIGTTVDTGSPLTVVGLGTTAPIGTTTGGLYMCVDSAGHTYGKSTCP